MKSFVILSAFIVASLAGNDNPQDRCGSGYQKEISDGGWEKANPSWTYFLKSDTCYQFNITIIGDMFVWTTATTTVDGIKGYTFMRKDKDSVWTNTLDGKTYNVYSKREGDLLIVCGVVPESPDTPPNFFVYTNTIEAQPDPFAGIRGKPEFKSLDITKCTSSQ